MLHVRIALLLRCSGEERGGDGEGGRWEKGWEAVGQEEERWRGEDGEVKGSGRESGRGRGQGEDGEKEGLGKRKGEDVGRGKGKGRGCGEGQMERGDEGGRRGWGEP
jgi:hypothetical protein